MKTTAKLVHFGRGGDTLYISANCKITGYGTPDNPHAAVIKPDRDIPDGTPVVDVRDAVNTKPGFSWVFRGPLLNVDLPDDKTNPIGDMDTPFHDALAAAGHSVAIGAARAHQASGSKAPGPLDEVGIAEYIRGWREHGARIGEYRDGEIVWAE